MSMKKKYQQMINLLQKNLDDLKSRREFLSKDYTKILMDNESMVKNNIYTECYISNGMQMLKDSIRISELDHQIETLIYILDRMGE